MQLCCIRGTTNFCIHKPCDSIVLEICKYKCRRYIYESTGEHWTIHSWRHRTPKRKMSASVRNWRPCLIHAPFLVELRTAHSLPAALHCFSVNSANCGKIPTTMVVVVVVVAFCFSIFSFFSVFFCFREIIINMTEMKRAMEIDCMCAWLQTNSHLQHCRRLPPLSVVCRVRARACVSEWMVLFYFIGKHRQ